MKPFFLWILLLPLIGHSQNYRLPLWPGPIPNALPSPYTQQADTNGIVRIRQVITPTLEVYLPAASRATGQAVVICPGGGYGILAYDWEGTDIAKWLNTHGIAGIVLKYRLPDEASNAIPHQSPLMDARQALLLVRKNSAAWHINPARVGIMGFSAGGHLAATAGTHFSAETRPDFMALIYPVITMKNEFTHQGSRTNLLGSKPDEALIEEFSNERHVTPDTPPTFLVHASDDEAVPVENSLQMYQALRDKGVAAEMHIYSYGGHGFSLATGQGYLATWPDRFIDWLNRIM